MTPQSYTSLKLYAECPYLYYRQYIRKDLPRESSPALERGNKVHSELETCVRDQKLPHNIWTPDGLLPRLWKLGARAEVPLALDADLQRVDFWDPAAVLRGKVDVVAVDGAQPRIWDWKTGQFRFDTLQAEVNRFLLLAGAPLPVEFSWVFVDQEQVHTELFEGKEGLLKVAGMVKEVNEAEDFPPKKNWRCGRFCTIPCRSGEC